MLMMKDDEETVTGLTEIFKHPKKKQAVDKVNVTNRRCGRKK